MAGILQDHLIYPLTKKEGIRFTTEDRTVLSLGTCTTSLDITPQCLTFLTTIILLSAEKNNER